MSDTVRVRLRSAPRIGARMPGWVLRVILLVAGVGLCISQFPLDAGGGFWFWVGIIVVAVAVAFPSTPAAWAFMVMTGISLLVRVPSPVDWRIYLLIAGVHLVHLVASYARVVPARSWVQLRAFATPLRRYILVQIPAQLVAAIALFAFAPRAGQYPSAFPVFGIVAAVAIIVLTLVLIVPIIAAHRRDVR